MLWDNRCVTRTWAEPVYFTEPYYLLVFFFLTGRKLLFQLGFQKPFSHASSSLAHIFYYQKASFHLTQGGGVRLWVQCGPVFHILRGQTTCHTSLSKYGRQYGKKLLMDTLAPNNKPKCAPSLHAEFKEPAKKLSTSSTVQPPSSHNSCVYT